MYKFLHVTDFGVIKETRLLSGILFYFLGFWAPYYITMKPDESMVFSHGYSTAPDNEPHLIRPSQTPPVVRLGPEKWRLATRSALNPREPNMV